MLCVKQRQLNWAYTTVLYHVRGSSIVYNWSELKRKEWSLTSVSWNDYQPSDNSLMITPFRQQSYCSGKILSFYNTETICAFLCINMELVFSHVSVEICWSETTVAEADLQTDQTRALPLCMLSKQTTHTRASFSRYFSLHFLLQHTAQ